MNKKISLRPYQKQASDYILQSEQCVLALCPSGGKTEISINVIDEYLKLFPKNRVLVLTHSTNVLLNNYLDRLNSVDVPFTYSDDLKSDSSVHVCIPANEHKIKGMYDFLIVDEAHENYLANRVQKIISKIKPSKQLLLTATPSKFIYEGNYNIFAIALDELDNNYFAKLNIELVASNYSWSENDYNEDEVKKSFTYTLEDTRKTVESVVLSLLKRLDSGLSAEQFNDPSLLTKVKLFFKKKTIELSPWSSTFNKVGKTLIVCNNIDQSDLVYSVLKDNGVNVGISHSKCDVNGLNISTFKNNDYDVLVVVDRCRIGYDDAFMMNLIDMSGTHNIDLIVMGSHGASGFQEMFIGSNTEKVVRNSNIPVLIIKREEDNFNANKFVFASDFSEEIKKPFEKVIEFANNFNSHLHLVNVNTPNNFKSTKVAQKQMSEFVAEFKIDNYSTHI
jgi:nucleotide-binding universal stress UspA family protein/superfamily II DNA or RNA helicase